MNKLPGAVILLPLPVWVIYSMPLFFLMLGIYVFLSKKRIDDKLKVIILAFVATLLLTPMPTGFVFFCFPNAYLVFGGFEYYQEVWVWFLVSGTITFICSATLFFWLISHNKQFTRDTAKGVLKWVLSKLIIGYDEKRFKKK